MPQNIMRSLCAVIRPDHFEFASYRPVSTMSLSFACLPSNRDFPFACLVDLICNVILLFFRERGSLQALQNNFPPELHRHSLGNSLSRAEIDTESGSLATWALLLITPSGGGLVRIFLFRAKSEGV